MPFVKIHFRLVQSSDGHPPVAVESLWGKAGKCADEYIVDSVPFFVRETTLGDTVRVREEDGAHWFVSVVSRSNNSLLRVVFFDKSGIAQVGKRLAEMGCSTELLADFNLMAVNVPGAVLTARLLHLGRTMPHRLARLRSET